MPSDIRSFFGGKGAPSATPKEEKTGAGKAEKSSNGKRRSNARVILDDSDDEPLVENKKSTPKKPAAKKVKRESPTGQETTTTDYFASSAKAKAMKSTPTKSKTTAASSRTGKSTPVKSELPARGSARKKAVTSYVELEDDDDAFLDDGEDAGDDIFAAEAKKGGRRKDDGYVEMSSDDDIKPKIKSKAASTRSKTLSKRDEDVDMKDVGKDDNMSELDDNESVIVDKPSKKTSQETSNKKRKSADLDSDQDSEASHHPKKSKTTSKKSKKDEPAESSEIQAIFDSIPTVRAPTPPPRDAEAKFDWRKNGTGNSGAPPAAGSKDIPVGAEDCLVGLTFVFTGLLETISREEGQELVKRYGGKITGGPSGKTSYVVIGSDAGPSKLEKIRKLNLKTINEDGLFELIRRLPANGGDSKAAEKSLEKRKADEEKIKREAEEMDRQEKKRVADELKAAQKVAQARGLTAPSNVRPKSQPKSELWTVKYAPTTMNQICGNKGQVEKIQKWLQKWPQSHRTGFRMGGADGSGLYRAIMIHGPPGIGKTTAAHLAAKLEGYDVIESNASDTRSKKLVESGLKEVLNNSSLLGFFAGDGKSVDAKKKKIVLIMDEVDGMSAGDRGGVGALAKVCKTTDIPMILICNERKSPKMKPFDHAAYDLPFRRPTVDMVRSRIATICHREGLKLDKQVIDALIEGSNKDIRQIVNMLSTAKLDQTAMDFDQGKAMSKAWEKHVILKPWDICHKLLGSGMFAPSSKATLNDKIELYFNDHEFSYLMIQENYLSTRPILSSNQGLNPKKERLKTLELADQAAESISDGDLVDRMIHGSQQQWSLMPTHAVFSSVRPASFISGAMSGNTNFTSWLGNNSKYGKLTRYVKEIQSHMRLRTSGDRHEIRQQYLPVLWSQLVKRLDVEGKEAVPDVIELMDSYFLTREDFDYIMELGLGPQRMEDIKLETQTKATFTRLYNSHSHPMPFMKASSVVAPQKAAKVAPDLEEAIEEEDEEILLEPKIEEDEIDDLSKDKFIKDKNKKAKKPAAPKKATAKKGKASKDDEDDEESDGDVKPKKVKAPTKTKGVGAKTKAKK